MTTVGHWIDGQSSEAGRETSPLYNPATGQVRGAVRHADDDEVDRVVETASKAFAAWSEESLSTRASVLYAFRDLVRKNIDDLAQLVTAEHGKTLPDARGEVVRGLETVEVACAVPSVLKGEYSDQVANGVDTYSLRQPVGVCVGVAPFNFPVMIPLFMGPLAVATGNAFILKPSERTPSASLALAELFTEAGLPPGVFSVLNGDRRVVDRLVEHSQVDAITLIGSTPVARDVYHRAAATGKRVQTFGGAKNHLVVMPDADMDHTADALVSAAFGSAGQRCMAISVAVTVGGAWELLKDKLLDRIERLTVGPGAGASVDMGPVISREAADRIKGYIDRGVSQGAELLVDGRSVNVPGHDSGFFVGPTVFAGVTPEMELYRDEIFGPVLSVTSVQNLDEALELLAANPYGNGAAVFTRSGGAARRFQREAPTGTVGVNVPIPVPVSSHGLGGWKDSRFGDQGLNADSLGFYTKPKWVTTRWRDDSSGVDMGFLSS